MSTSRIEPDTITSGRVLPYRAGALVAMPAAIDPLMERARRRAPGRRTRLVCDEWTPNEEARADGGPGSSGRFKWDYGRIMPFAEPFHVAEVPSVAVPV